MAVELSRKVQVMQTPVEVELSLYDNLVFALDANDLVLFCPTNESYTTHHSKSQMLEITQVPFKAI